MSQVIKKFYITLDINREDTNPAFHLIEGDTANQLIITLVDNGTAVDLSTALINIVVSSRNGIFSQTNDPLIDDNGVTVSGAGNNIITVDLHRSTFGVGLNEVEIQIYTKSADSDDYDLLATTARFNFDCVRSLANDDTMNTVYEFPILSALISQVQTALAEALPWTDVNVTAQAGNAADVTVTVGDDSIDMVFTIPNSVYVGATPPTGDEEVWIIPTGDGEVEDHIMGTAVYDQDENGIVDNSEALEGHAASYFATATGLSNEVTARENAISGEETARNTAISDAINTYVNNKLNASGGIAILNSDSKLLATEASSKVVEVTSSRDVNVTDNGCFLLCTTANMTLTLKKHSAIALPVGAEIEICRYSNKTVTIAAASGVNLYSANSAKKIAAQYGTACLKQVEEDKWLLCGLLEV